MPTGQYDRFPGLNDGLSSDVRRCSKCRAVKPRSAYSPDRRNTTDGLQSTCKECRKAREAAWRAANPEEVARRAHASYLKYRERKDAYGREWRKKNPHAHRGYELKRRYGLTIAHLEAMKASQGNACAICRRPFKKGGKGPHVDHDHATGKVRGILCGGCNIVLGHLEKPGYTEAAQAYLRLHSGLQTEPRVA